MQHQISIPADVLEDLLRHASSASRLVGHLDDHVNADLVGHLADEIDAVVHGLSEILGDPGVLVVADAVAPDDRGARDSAPMLTAGAGGAP